jgi:hypothetical protein
MHSVFLVKSGVTAWPASEGREDGDGEGGRAPVAAEGEEGDGEREALRTRERREAAASVGGRRGGVGGVGFLGGVLWADWPNKGLCGRAGEWGFGLCRALYY